MNVLVTEDIKTAVKDLYEVDTNAAKLFDWLAERKRASAATSIESIAWKVGITRWEAVALARQLDEAGCGQFKNGRRGSKSRIEWTYNCIQLGKAASGESVAIERTSELDLSYFESDDEEEADSIEAGEKLVPIQQMIAEAKQALAERAGLSVTQIEIQIRF